jgi:hypothetical protein
VLKGAAILVKLPCCILAKSFCSRGPWQQPLPHDLERDTNLVRVEAGEHCLGGGANSRVPQLLVLHEALDLSEQRSAGEDSLPCIVPCLAQVCGAATTREQHVLDLRSQARLVPRAFALANPRRERESAHDVQPLLPRPARVAHPPVQLFKRAKAAAVLVEVIENLVEHSAAALVTAARHHEVDELFEVKGAFLRCVHGPEQIRQTYRMHAAALSERHSHRPRF